MAERLFSLWMRRGRGNITQTEIAARLGVSQPVISHRESGASTGETGLRSTAQALGLTLREFLLDQLAADETRTSTRQALRKAQAAERAKREAGQPGEEHVLATILTAARLSRGIGAREFRAMVPGVDAADTRGYDVREATVEKAAEALKMSVRDLLIEGLLYDAAAEKALEVDQDALRTRLNALVVTRHEDAQARKIAALTGIHESRISKFRKGPAALTRPGDGILTAESARKLLEVVEDLERRLKLVLGGAGEKPPEGEPDA